MTTRATACPHCRNWHRYHSTFVCGWCYTRHLGAIVTGAVGYTVTLPVVTKPGAFRGEIVEVVSK